MLSACGGGGSGASSTVAPATPSVAPTPTPTPTPGATTSACSLNARQDWVLAQMREWYLFPETLPGAPNPAAFGTLDDWVDSLTATARGQGRDRYFTYVTSIAAEQAFYDSGESAGYGFRLGADAASGRAGILEVFEGAPALEAGLDRGTEIVAVGPTVASLRTVSDIIAAEGIGGLNTALGATAPGTTRVLRVQDGSGTREVTLTARTYDVAPISTRTGVRILDGADGKVGYVNLRTFINPADPALRQAFARFRAEGVRDLIVDVRYNGGGLVSIANLLSDLIGGDRSINDVQSRVAFRPEKASENSVRNFSPQPESIAPRRIAFIGTGGTASASELVVNNFIPYLGANVALIGSNTFGKPVGQIALDRTECDDRLRVVAFSIRNRDNAGDYYSGLGSVVRASCQAPDDPGFAMGDPREGSTRAALDFIAGRSCTPIGAGAAALSASAARSGGTGQRRLVLPDRPTPAQREVPGLF